MWFNRLTSTDIARLQTNYSQRRTVKGKSSDDLVFTTQLKHPWSQANLAKAHREVQIALGLPDSMTTYSWRHARISELTKWGHMDAEAAEQQFQQIEHASLTASLKRHHGIAH